MQGPDTDAQDQPPPFIHIRLATHGRSIQMGQSRRFWHVGGMSGLRSISEVPDVQGLPVEDIGSDLIQASRPEPRIVRYELTDFEWAARHHRSAQRTSVDPTPRKRHMPSENGSHRSRMADTLMSQFQRRPENAF